MIGVTEGAVNAAMCSSAAADFAGRTRRGAGDAGAGGGQEHVLLEVEALGARGHAKHLALWQRPLRAPGRGHEARDSIKVVSGVGGQLVITGLCLKHGSLRFALFPLRAGATGCRCRRRLLSLPLLVDEEGALRRSQEHGGACAGPAVARLATTSAKTPAVAPMATTSAKAPSATTPNTTIVSPAAISPSATPATGASIAAAAVAASPATTTTPTPRITDATSSFAIAAAAPASAPTPAPIAPVHRTRRQTPTPENARDGHHTRIDTTPDNQPPHAPDNNQIHKSSIDTPETARLLPPDTPTAPS